MRNTTDTYYCFKHTKEEKSVNIARDEKKNYYDKGDCEDCWFTPVPPLTQTTHCVAYFLSFVLSHSYIVGRIVIAFTVFADIGIAGFRVVFVVEIDIKASIRRVKIFDIIRVDALSVNNDGRFDN